MDESTDNQDTAQLLVFIRGIDENFVITEELLGLQSIKSTTTGRDLFENVVDCVEKMPCHEIKWQASKQMEPEHSLEKMWA